MDEVSERILDEIRVTQGGKTCTSVDKNSENSNSINEDV